MSMHDHNFTRFGKMCIVCIINPPKPKFEIWMCQLCTFCKYDHIRFPYRIMCTANIMIAQYNLLYVEHVHNSFTASVCLYQLCLDSGCYAFP